MEENYHSKQVKRQKVGFFGKCEAIHFVQNPGNKKKSPLDFVACGHTYLWSPNTCWFYLKWETIRDIRRCFIVEQERHLHRIENKSWGLWFATYACLSLCLRVQRWPGGRRTEGSIPHQSFSLRHDFVCEIQILPRMSLLKQFWIWASKFFSEMVFQAISQISMKAFALNEG